MARHRADLPVSTPLTDFGSALAAPVAAAGKGGLVVAVSSGLVAGVVLPASSAAAAPRDAATTASIPLVNGLAGDAAVTSQPVSAPSTARVAFEHEALRPVATKATTHASPAAASRQVSDISRSLARQAYQSTLRAAAQAEAKAAAQTARPKAAPATRTVSTTAVRSAGARGTSVIALASRYLGIPYVYGGSSPRGFDCSGLTQYVYGLLGVSLPRTAGAQYAATTRVSRSAAQPGDLVFFFTGGSVTHVGIYLGGNMMIAAPHTGDVVKKQEIYSANVAFGRV